MPLVWTLLTLAVAVLIAPAACARLGRAAGWPLAGLYLIATATLWPAVTAVMKGTNPTWRASWVPALGVEISLRADGLGIVFALIALLIGAVVFAYSTRYLGPGPQTSFYLVMTLFTLAMLGLVLADDLIWFFLCWELTSIASFLLIARSGHAGEQASMRTLFITFTGGLALLVALTLIAHRTRTGSLSAALSHTVWHDDPAFAATVAALVAIAGFTKSAQFPFHIWLPDAMAAITPVSAYLHAAAVVKAGVFLLLRFTPAFHHVPTWNILLISLGLTTAALGAWFALQQTDLKKLMAYSTVSQLGLLVATIGVGTAAAVAAAVLHTIAHALFKSGLFMMVGVVDHATHTRDLRRLPQLYRAMPVSFAVTVLGCASMAGIPPMLGFASKESLLTGLLSAPGPSWTGPVAMGAAVASSVLTFAYCTKIVFGGFVDGRGDRPVEAVEKSLLVPAALPILAGLPLGAAVGLLDTPVGRAVDAALPGAGGDVHLSLWHGITAELGATLLIFALGGIVVATRRALWPRLERPSLPWDGPAAVNALTRGLTRLGEAWSRPLAVDYPSRHVALLFAAFVAVTLPALVAATDAVGLPPNPAGSTRPVDILLAVLITAAVIGVCRATSRLAAVVSLSAVGALCTVQILALGAPDVTLTQLLVETLTVVMMMLVLQKLPLNFGEHPPRQRRLAVGLALGVGLAAGAATFVLNGRREHGDVAGYFQRETLDLSGGTNIVNVILVEFRALDTLGELSVLGMAGVVLVAVLSTVRDRHLDPDPAKRPSRGTEQDEPLPQLRAPGTTAHRAITEAWSNVLPMQLMLRLVTPLLVLLSLLIFVRGHNAPGGGFIAALVGSATIGLAYLSTSRDRQLGRPRLPLRLIGGGILVAVTTGVWGLVAEGSFLDPLSGHLGTAHLTSSMLFDVGVYAAVLGLVMVAFNLLGTSDASTDHDGGEDTRERVDEAVEGELSGPLDTVRGETAPSGRRVGVGTEHLATGRQPKEVGR
ncbi:multicomponent Na+:H+ antiporter subunit A [Austwickia chelonae]|uniref:Na(+)/H(+) antiporter subunit A/B n=1 Tax=Austwickia chelonae NBRC 105200 TaxID=1184607 RepID=K6VPQ8_9MICO|nr:DUF4040 family protein [Austwickia chelonae]GAB78724.1 Na(+)/H(+) antiporter subunit A/B [Austwickia chelonae NBRC 105200]SEW35052.1 multicomponent Na+:H+ antiporter subunit A [Austwickia chelonae]